MARWFATRNEANKKAIKINKSTSINANKVYRWKHTKRKKPYFVGTYIEWINLY